MPDPSPSVRARRPASAKLVGPLVVPPQIERAALEARLETALSRRLVTIVADAGFGKSTLVSACVQRRSHAWYTVTPDDAEISTFASGLVEALSVRIPAIGSTVHDWLAAGRGPDHDASESIRAGAHAALVADAVAERTTRDPLVLVIDDLGEIEPGGATQFLDVLVRMAPAGLGIVVASRAPLPFAVERLRGQGHVASFSGHDLAFSTSETAALVAAVVGDGGEVAAMVHRVTNGWPAAVRLVADLLQTVVPEERAATLERAVRPGGPIDAYLAEEAIDRLRAPTREVVELAAVVPRLAPELAAALGVPDASAHVGELVARGLLLESSGGTGWYRPTPLVGRYVLERAARDADRTRRRRRAAAVWFGEQGMAADAVACAMPSGDRDLLAELLCTWGEALLADSHLDLVLEALGTLEGTTSATPLTELSAAAHQLHGDWDAALRALATLTAGDGPVRAAVAWRTGQILQLRGELQGAIGVYERADLGTGSAPADRAMVLAWWAAARWLRGELDASRELCAAALEAAEAADDDRSLSATHTVLAMLAATDSDRRANDAHYVRAREHARRAGDTMQLIRIHANRGSRLTEEGYYAEALAELDEAIRRADLGGFAAFRALAMTNRGEALARLGRLDEATAELEAARDVYSGLGSRSVSYALAQLGDVSRERGDLALARGLYEEAITAAGPTGDVQALVPARCGLALVVVEQDPDRAGELVAEAMTSGPVLGRATALLAAGWVALATGDRAAATSWAHEAEALARQRRDRPSLAAAIELWAQAAGPDPELGARLDEARSLWRAVGSPLGRARTELAIAELTDAPEGAELARSALATFLELGARRHAAAARHLVEGVEQLADVEIRTLGGFAVLRRGRQVALSEWRSRKARDCLKRLIAANGGRVTREQLLESLWPGDDGERSGPRLSVALSTIRSVLDPSKRHAPDHFLASDRDSAWLRLDHCLVDVDVLLRASAGATHLASVGARTAKAALQHAESMYRGDFLPEDVYEEWTAPLRGEATAAYQQVAGSLADLAGAAGDHAAAASYRMRLLERDPWDEASHLALVSSLAAAGRHGEARRAYRRYTRRMDELAVEASPFPAMATPA